MTSSGYARSATSTTGSSSADVEQSTDPQAGGSLTSLPAWATGPQASCSGCSSDHPCSDCGEEVQPKVDPDARTAPAHGPTGPVLPSGQGSPLEPADLKRFSSAFGQDLTNVRLHTGSESSELARSHGALAYTTGSDVVLGGSYVAGSREGDLLMAHELAHVVHQRPGRAGAEGTTDDGASSARFEEEADRAAEQAVTGQPVGELSGLVRQEVQLAPSADPPDSTLTASLAWFAFEPVKGATYEEGDENLQLCGMVLKNLLGPGYTAELRDKILADLPRTLRFEGVKSDLKKGEPYFGARLRPESLQGIVVACAKEKVATTLSAEKLGYLQLGLTANATYRELKSVFPAWFSRELFDAVVASHGLLLREVASGTSEATDIGRAIIPAVDAVDAIRQDTALTGHDGYTYLWARPPGAPPSVAGVDTVPRLDPAAWLLSYAEARPKATGLASRGAEGAAARKALLDGFVATYDIKQLRPTTKGDQPLSEVPSAYTAPPYPSTLSIYPQLDAGLYGSTRAEYGFEMALQFPNIASAFQFHRYDFTAFRVPDDKLINAAQAMKGPGREPSHWDMMTGRLARDRRYEQADVRAYGNRLWSTLGPPGMTIEPARINAALRYAGTIVGSLIETIFDPSYVARFSFGDEGLYIVRCVATWEPGTEVALKRPPSVAWVLLFTRAPELLAEQHLQEVVSDQDEATRRIAQIDKDLRSVQDSRRKADLESERARLVAATGDVQGLLTFQRDSFRGSGDQGAQDRADQLDKILGTRTKLGFGKGTERLPATFVNDAGQLIDLLIEVKTTNKRGDDDADYEVKDSTTSSSTWAKASGSRHKAILAALTEIFQGSDYGRGRATVLLDGTYEPIDINTVSAGKMFMEALSNTATILSIIAIALAPVTLGESMALLIPAMVIGAVPSAYNIVRRGLIDKTLHADLALAMDIVNVVGAAVGVGAETRAGLQAIKLGTAGGKVLIVLGVGAMGSGVLVMGASVLQQLEAVGSMPEGLQQAEVVKILSHAMLQAGIMMGALLAAQLKVEGARQGGTFEDWMSSLDEPSRSAIERSRTETEPTRNLWRTWAEMDPVVRDLLTQCGSGCVPGEPPSKADQARIKSLANGLSEQGYRTLQGLLHDNRATADLKGLLSGLESARSAAPKSRGGTKKTAAVEAEILSRGTVANDLLAKLSEEGVNTRASGTPDPQRWARTVKLAEEVGKAGKIPIKILRQVMDHIRVVEGANPEEVLLFLQRLGELYGKVPGVDNLLGTRGLTGRYLDFEGARWTCQFLEDNALWGKVKSFEDPVPGAIDRVVDVRLTDGSRIELKSWEKWHNWADVSFSRQIMGDYLGTSGFTSETVKWVFESGGTKGVESVDALLKKMNAALDQALAEGWEHYDDSGAAARVKRIKAALPDIVRVGTL